MAAPIHLEDGTTPIHLEDGTTILEMEGTTGYTMTADVVAFTYTGNSALLRTANQLPVTVGPFTLTGNAAGVRRANKLSVTVGTFSLTGQTALFPKTYGLSAGAGVFTYSGTTTGIGAGRRLVTEFPPLPPINIQTTPGIESITLDWEAPISLFYTYGRSAALSTGYQLLAGQGTFVFTTVDSRLFKTPAALIAQPPLAQPLNLVAEAQGDDGAYLTWTAGYSFVTIGSDVNFIRENRMTAHMPPTVPIGITATPLPGGMNLEWAEGPLFGLTGSDVDFPLGTGLVAGSVSFVSAFNDAGFTAVRRLSTELAAYAYTGNSANLWRSLQILAAQGAFALTGNAADLIYTQQDLILNAATGAFSLTGNDVTFRQTHVLLVGSFVWTGNDAIFRLGTGFDLPRGEVVVVLVPLDTAVNLLSTESGVQIVSTQSGIHLE